MRGKSIKPPPKGMRLYRDKWFVPDSMEDHWVELYLFGKSKQGEAKLDHWKRWVEMQWPEPTFQWDEWCDLFFGSLCGATETIERVTGVKVEPGKWHREVVCTGSAATGKS